MGVPIRNGETNRQSFSSACLWASRKGIGVSFVIPFQLTHGQEEMHYFCFTIAYGHAHTQWGNEKENRAIDVSIELADPTLQKVEPETDLKRYSSVTGNAIPRSVRFKNKQLKSSVFLFTKKFSRIVALRYERTRGLLDFKRERSQKTRLPGTSWFSSTTIDYLLPFVLTELRLAPEKKCRAVFLHNFSKIKRPRTSSTSKNNMFLNEYR